MESGDTSGEGYDEPCILAFLREAERGVGLTEASTGVSEEPPLQRP